MKMRKLPEGFLLGVASSSYQIEGAWNAADKSPSICDTFFQKPGSTLDNSNGDDTCKSYEFYKKDVNLVKFLGADFYRFSISWSRILPTGYPNKISEDGYNYYNNLINCLLENNIQPIVTIYHWDLPQNLQDLGGWANPLIVDWFGDYAKVLYKLYGDRVKTWITINEPKQFGVGGYGLKMMAPAINAHGIAEYIAAKNIVMAHARAWHIYNDEFRKTQNGICGITIATDYRQGMDDSPEEVQYGLEVMDFEVGLYSHPIFTTKGGFPESVIKRVAAQSAEQGFPKSRLPEYTPDEIEYCKGTSDFYGFNHYSTRFYSKEKYDPSSGIYPNPSYQDDIGGVFTYLDYEKGAVPHVTIIPHGFRKALNWVKNNCNNPPIMITENGFATLGGLKDYDRISYYQKYLDAMFDAIELDGCNVTHYAAWSLLDNFEWTFGLNIRFGLFEVDFEDENRTRTARSSAAWYKNFIRTRTLSDDSVPFIEYSE